MFSNLRAPGLRGQNWRELGCLGSVQSRRWWNDDASVQPGLHEIVTTVQVNQLGGVWRWGLERALQMRTRASQVDVLQNNEATEALVDGANVVAGADAGKHKGNRIVIVVEVTEDLG